MNPLIVVKVGGSILEKDTLNALMREVLMLHGKGSRIIIVHGGGRQMKEYATAFGKEQKIVGRWRITDDETLRILKMVAGEMNIEIVSLLGGKGVGLCGASANTVIAEEKEYEGKQWVGYVGRPKKANKKFLEYLIDSGHIPVISFIAKGEKERCLNVNADELAGFLAHSLKAQHLVLLTDVAGVLRADGSLFETLTVEQARELQTGGGMRFKLDGALIAAKSGTRVIIADGKKCNAIQEALLCKGTVISG